MKEPCVLCLARDFSAYFLRIAHCPYSMAVLYQTYITFLGLVGGAGETPNEKRRASALHVGPDIFRVAKHADVVDSDLAEPRGQPPLEL